MIYIYNYIIMTNHQSYDYRQQRGSHRIFDILEEKSHFWKLMPFHDTRIETQYRNGNDEIAKKLKKILCGESQIIGSIRCADERGIRS